MPLFLLDKNLGLRTDEPPVADAVRAGGYRVEQTTDLPDLDRRVAAHEPDVVYLPIADFHRLTAKGDRHYAGLAIATSKFTGTTRLPSVLVVRRDDPATGLGDLAGAAYGYINKSCSSSYFPPAVLLARQGERLADFFRLQAVDPWQGQIDAVAAGRVRATMVPEDVWRTEPGNAGTTKVVGRYDTATPAVVVARHDLDRDDRRRLLDALVAWSPRWADTYGPFRPYAYADVYAYFHDLDQLPAGT